MCLPPYVRSTGEYAGDLRIRHIKEIVVLEIKGGLYLKPSETTKILSTYLSCHNFFSLSSVQIIIVPACCLLCVL